MTFHKVSPNRILVIRHELFENESHCLTLFPTLAVQDGCSVQKQLPRGVL